MGSCEYIDKDTITQQRVNINYLLVYGIFF